MAVGGHFPSLSEAASAIGAYFAGNHQTQEASRCTTGSVLERRSKGRVVVVESEKTTPRVPEASQPRFAPEFDGLHSFETLVAR